MNTNQLTEDQRRAYAEECARLQAAIAPLIKDAQHDVAMSALLGLYRALALHFTCCTLVCAEVLTTVAADLLKAAKDNGDTAPPPAAGSTRLH